MALKDLSTLIFYEERLPSANRGSIGRPLLFGIFTSQTAPATFMAAALVDLDEGGNAIVTNIAAEDGYGPAMYACLMQMITEDGKGWLYPTQKKGEIVRKSKEIWRQFHDDYSGRILTTQPSTGPHDEPWLNCGYRVSENALVNLRSMRDRYSQYRDLMDQHFGESALRGEAFDLCQMSTAPYQGR